MAVVQNCLLVAFALLLVMGPVFDFIPVAWHDQQRLMQLPLLFSTLLVIALRPASHVMGFFSAPTKVAAIGVLLCGFLSAMSARQSAWAILEWGLLAAVLISVVAIAAAIQNQPWPACKVAAFGIAGFVLLYAVKTLAALSAVVIASAPLDTMNLIDGFNNRRFLGQVLTMAWPLLISFATCVTAPKARRVLLVAAAVSVYLALISQTRGTLWALVIVLLAIRFIAPPQRSWWLYLFRTLAAGVLLYAVLILGAGYVFGADGIELHFGDGGVSGRDELWSAALGLMQANPWLGAGPMGFAALREQYGAHPHNSALQIAAEWGIPAALLLGSMIIAGVCKFAVLLRTQQRQGSAAMGIGLFVALTASLLQSLVDGVFVMPMSQMFLAAVSGASIAWCMQHATVRDGHIPSPWWLRAMSLIVAVSLIAGLQVTAELNVNGFTKQDSCISNTPRFWACGTIAP